MIPRSTKKSAQKIKFAKALGVEQLTGLAAQLLNSRTYPPLVKREDGKYEGDILGFVKGLRLSAGIIYFLRERLSATGLEVSWGHVIDTNEQSCSPECDVVIHAPGHVRKWNGNIKPIMDFTFIEAGNVRAVVSCKSILNSIDKSYPKDLMKYGVKNVFLFAECCPQTQFPTLRTRAKSAGYSGLWCLYLMGKEVSDCQFDEGMYGDFADSILKALK